MTEELRERFARAKSTSTKYLEDEVTRAYDKAQKEMNRVHKLESDNDITIQLVEKVYDLFAEAREYAEKYDMDRKRLEQCIANAYVDCVDKGFISGNGNDDEYVY